MASKKRTAQSHKSLEDSFFIVKTNITEAFLLFVVHLVVQPEILNEKKNLLSHLLNRTLVVLPKHTFPIFLTYYSKHTSRKVAQYLILDRRPFLRALRKVL